MKNTKDHAEIIEWVEKHGGKPSVIDYPEAEKDKIGIKIDFPGSEDQELLSSKALRNTSWDHFFSVFDSQGLYFSYVENPDNDTNPADWYKFGKIET